ncbi:hypothetical protein DEO72_LG1g2974 [Vigna unguiculata]|uniref:Homologous recombination OB-fold protein OB-fold domain-containing protein n=1 Tax=Vigna unguiculata TaxID=3917 RepID=A0A4D6KS10_VIGUN|nr:hypothetical protein DEO72_LG1g2974 [Vigna unguiculata]
MHFMACVVKECKPNMLGDMLITMKDPSDIVKASIHNKVLKDAKFGSDIVVGSVLLLKEVFKYDISPPTEEEVKASLLVMRLNYVPKQTIDEHMETNVQSNLNINMDHNVEANVGTNNPPELWPTSWHFPR